MREQKPLKYTALEGLSEKQLQEHHGVLYAGYVKKWNEIQEKLKTADRANPNGTFSELRELKLEETFALNGIKLHEGYFDGMGPGAATSGQLPATSAIRKWIEEDFGSFEKWLEEFKAMGVAARGWVVLAMDLDDGRLHNILCDSHNQGGVWNAVALLIMDVYEHAYFFDFATARKAYIDVFVKNIDWAVAEAVAERFRLAEFRK